MSETVISIENLCTRFGDAVVHENLSLEIEAGEVFAIAGSSGCGKSTLLREIIMLQKPVSGSIRVFGLDVLALAGKEVLELRKRWGVMFERGALFSSLTVLENVMLPIEEHVDLPREMIEDIALLKVRLAGLSEDAAGKYPSELSGGMRKRAALARAMALDPELLFLDEPTAGLDPLSASGFEELVSHLKDSLRLTMVVITHDLDLLWHVADRVAFLGEGRVLGVGSMKALSESEDPLIREYFYGPRGRAAWEQQWKRK